MAYQTSWGTGDATVAVDDTAERQPAYVLSQWGVMQPSNSVMTTATGDVFIDALGNVVGAQPE